MVVGKKRNQFPFGSQATGNGHKLATKTWGTPEMLDLLLPSPTAEFF